MEVAVLVNCNGLAVAYTNRRLWFVGQIDTDTTRLGLNIDEGDMMLRQHRVCHATHLNLDMVVINRCYTISFPAAKNT